MAKAYDFLFEGKNNEYDEEYKDYIEEENKKMEEKLKKIYNKFDPTACYEGYFLSVGDIEYLIEQSEKINEIDDLIEDNVNMNAEDILDEIEKIIRNEN